MPPGGRPAVAVVRVADPATRAADPRIGTKGRSMSEPDLTDHLVVRPRRLRRTRALRRLATETRLDPAELVLPIFYREGLVSPKAIPSMPGVVQHTEDSLRVAVNDAAAAGLGRRRDAARAGW